MTWVSGRPAAVKNKGGGDELSLTKMSIMDTNSPNKFGTLGSQAQARDSEMRTPDLLWDNVFLPQWFMTPPSLPPDAWKTLRIFQSDITIHKLFTTKPSQILEPQEETGEKFMATCPAINSAAKWGPTEREFLLPSSHGKEATKGNKTNMKQSTGDYIGCGPPTLQ